MGGMDRTNIWNLIVAPENLLYITFLKKKWIFLRCEQHFLSCKRTGHDFLAWDKIFCPREKLVCLRQHFFVLHILFVHAEEQGIRLYEGVPFSSCVTVSALLSACTYGCRKSSWKNADVKSLCQRVPKVVILKRIL